MNNLPKLSLRKKYSGYSPKSADVSIPIMHKKPEMFRKRKTLMRKPLSLPLTHLLVNKDETYDISKEYEFMNLLGFGTYSQVKLARRLKDDKMVAVKIGRGNTAMEMLKKERHILENLDCSFFPKVYDFKIDKLWNRAYLFLENIQGKSLKKFIETTENITSEIIESFISQMCTMVKYLHGKKIGHRDIKPENIIVTADFQLKLLDFNISRKWDKPSEEATQNIIFFTQISTPLYAAPEVYSGQGYSPSIDVWGIGVIGYLLCQGAINEADCRNPDVLASRSLIFRSYIQEFSNISDSLKSFILRGLEENPDLRPSVNDQEFLLYASESGLLTDCTKFEELKEVNEDE